MSPSHYLFFFISDLTNTHNQVLLWDEQAGLVRVWYLLYLWNGKVGCLGGKPRFLSVTRKDDCGEKERLGDAPHVKQSAGHTEPWEKPTALKLSSWKVKNYQVSEQCQPKSGICNCVNQLLALRSNCVHLQWEATQSLCPARCHRGHSVFVQSVGWKLACTQYILSMCTYLLWDAPPVVTFNDIGNIEWSQPASSVGFYIFGSHRVERLL